MDVLSMEYTIHPTQTIVDYAQEPLCLFYYHRKPEVPSGT